MEGEGQVVAERNGQPQGQHRHEVHGPYAQAHGASAAGDPAAGGAGMGGCGDVPGHVQGGIGGQDRDGERTQDQVRVVTAGHRGTAAKVTGLIGRPRRIWSLKLHRSCPGGRSCRDQSLWHSGCASGPSATAIAACLAPRGGAASAARAASRPWSSGGRAVRTCRVSPAETARYYIGLPFRRHPDPVAKSSSKSRIAYVCGECGAEYSKWQGQCGECQAWNSLSQVVLEPASGAGAATPAARRSGWAGKVDPPKVTALKDVSQAAEVRVSTGIGELDRVLGGGLVEGAVVLVGGDPGIGKSTLLLQAVAKMAAQLPAL